MGEMFTGKSRMTIAATVCTPEGGLNRTGLTLFVKSRKPEAGFTSYAQGCHAVAPTTSAGHQVFLARARRDGTASYNTGNSLVDCRMGFLRYGYPAYDAV
jgi:hypothetical protein